MTKNIVALLHIALSLTLTLLIFLQSTSESESRSNILSTTNFEKRGWEKTIFYFTLLILSVFLISSIIQTLI